jgi:hypothetical protein
VRQCHKPAANFRSQLIIVIERKLGGSQFANDLVDGARAQARPSGAASTRDRLVLLMLAVASGRIKTPANIVQPNSPAADRDEPLRTVDLAPTLDASLTSGRILGGEKGCLAPPVQVADAVARCEIMAAWTAANDAGALCFFWPRTGRKFSVLTVRTVRTVRTDATVLLRGATVRLSVRPKPIVSILFF